MSRKPLAARYLTVGAAVALLCATGSAASAAPGRSETETAEGGLRITGTMTFSVFIPGDVWITGGVSGGETQTGTFKFDLTSTHLPFDDEWAFKGSSYDVKDKVDVTWTPPPPTSCSFTYTAMATAGGDFPARQTVKNQTFITADWWANSYDDPLIAAGGQVETHEDVKVKVHGGSACGKDSEYTRPYVIWPICFKIPGSLFTTGGPFDGKNDTINLDCKSTTDDKTKYDIKGTLHVDAYMFVLPRDALTAKEWERVLQKPHHDYPAADIPVPVGTPYYAVTAGTVRYTTSKSCGTGITLVGMDGVHYTYCHGSKRIAEADQVVPPGTELGLTGETGSAKGPHLHFEIRIDNKQHCPQALLWDLYDSTQPAPDAHFVESLPTTGCSYKNK